MKYSVVDTGTRCVAEGQYAGHLARVVTGWDVHADNYVVHVYILKLDDYGRAPKDSGVKVDTSLRRGNSMEDAFEIGFDAAEHAIDGYTKIT